MDKRSLDNYITGHYGEDQFTTPTKAYHIGNPPFMTIEDTGRDLIPHVRHKDYDNKWRRAYMGSRSQVARMLRFYRKQPGLVIRATDQRI